MFMARQSLNIDDLVDKSVTLTSSKSWQLFKILMKMA